MNRDKLLQAMLFITAWSLIGYGVHRYWKSNPAPQKHTVYRVITVVYRDDGKWVFDRNEGDSDEGGEE